MRSMSSAPSEGSNAVERLNEPAQDATSTYAVPALEAERAPQPKGRAVWFGRGVGAIADQGVFSLSNMMLMILLARFLPRESWDAFSAAYVIFLLLGSAHNALLMETLLVFGASHYAAKLRQYLGVLLGLEVIVSAVIVLSLASAGAAFWMLGDPWMAWAMFTIAVAAPFVYLSWLMRRPAYLRSKPQMAALAGTLYLVIMLGGLFALEFAGMFNLLLAMAVLALSALCSSLWLIRIERVQLPSSWTSPLVKDVVKRHWNYGRWAVFSQILVLLPSQLPFFLLYVMGLPKETGEMRAIGNLVLPVIQATGAISTLLLPSMVRNRNSTAFIRVFFIGMVVLVGAPLVYALLLTLAQQPVMELVYGGRYYTPMLLVFLTSLMAPASGLLLTLNLVLQSHERPQLMFYGSLIAGAGALTLGPILILWLGAYGAALSITVSLILGAAASFFLGRHLWLSGRHA